MRSTEESMCGTEWYEKGHMCREGFKDKEPGEHRQLEKVCQNCETKWEENEAMWLRKKQNREEGSKWQATRSTNSQVEV